MSSPTVRLPPLATLQAFDAAVRHKSYSRAAEELHLTHGAISRHVAALERRVGRKLFVRERQQMEPTSAARLLVTQIRQSLAMLERSFASGAAAPSATARRKLTLSVLPAFASRWMVPRLAEAMRQLPDLQLTLDIDFALAKLSAGHADCAVRFGVGGWADIQQQALYRDEQFPVCAPHYRDGALPRTAQEIVAADLLANPWLPWEPWLDAAGVEGPLPRPALTITDSSVLLDAAVAGLGVAIGRASLVEADLRAGRLIRLSAISVPDPHQFWFVWRADHPQLDDVLRLGQWLQRQAEAMRTP